MITTIWRTEIWHPLSVHFPITLLVTATLTGVSALFLNSQRKKNWQQASGILLLAGIITAWLSIYTGSLADGVVARQICDPTVLKNHEIAAYTLAYLFSAAALIHLIIHCVPLKNKYKSVLSYLSVILMITGTGYVGYAGHLGASLVYEQGAGVNKPSADCSGFQ